MSRSSMIGNCIGCGYQYQDYCLCSCHKDKDNIEEWFNRIDRIMLIVGILTLIGVGWIAVRAVQHMFGG
jgi:hypothetical protein